MHCQFEGAAQVQQYSLILHGTLSRFTPQSMRLKVIVVPMTSIPPVRVSLLLFDWSELKQMCSPHKPVERVLPWTCD